MTLEEAIKRYTSNAFYEKSDGNLQGYLEFNQLAEWLKELKESRKFKKKASIVISQLRADRDLLEKVLEEIRAEILENEKIEHIPEDVNMWHYISGLDKALSIIDKHRTETDRERVINVSADQIDPDNM